MTLAAKSRRVKTLAATLGFDRVGIAPVKAPAHADYYKAWLAAGHAGSMSYLQRNTASRLDPSRLLPGARSIICVALNYGRPAADGQGNPRPAPPPTRRRPGRRDDRAAASGRVARYARGRDYHLVLRRMLAELVQRLRRELGQRFEARICVDTAPLLEREVAHAAGLGWIGKNTCLLHERLGSYLFLAEVLTTLALEPDSPLPGRCGSCTRCLEACPTGAFPAAYRLDASRCISYLTIEHRGQIPAQFQAAIGDWVFGCDICQEVCPFNVKAPPASHPEIAADLLPARLELRPLLQLGSGAYRRLTRGTAAARATRNMWRRNAAIVLANLTTARGSGAPTQQRPWRHEHVARRGGRAPSRPLAN